MKLNELQIAAIGVLGVVFLEVIALLKGVNGTMFGASMAAVGGIVGYAIKSRWGYEKDGK